MQTKSIRQTAFFKTSPHNVYEALMDAKIHARFTGGKATINRKVGGKFSVFDGYAEGVTLELVPDAKIVQSWRASDWPEGVFSKATFSMQPEAGGTRLTFTQSGVPVDQVDDIKQGWRDYYWTPMKELLDR